MSARHAKRVQRLQEEAAAAASDDDEDDDYIRKPSGSAFGLGLLQDSEPDESEPDDDDEPPAPVPAPAPAPAPAPTPSHGSGKKNKKRNKPSAKDQAEEEEDEDALLAALARENAACPTPATDEETDAVANASELLKLSTAHLDATNELSRTFGARTLRKIAAAERAEHRPQQPPHQQRRAATKAIFVRPRDTWPPPRSGLGMELQRTEGGVSWFVFTRSSLYVQSEAELQACVDSADPNLLQRLLQIYPYQLDGLLRLAEYCAHTGRHELSAELVEVRTTTHLERTHRQIGL